MVCVRGRELHGPATGGGCGDAAAALEARLFLVAGEGHGHQATFMWPINRYRDTDRLGEIVLGNSSTFGEIRV